jgi:hypothetical protein
VPLRDPALDHAVVNVRDQMDRAVEIYRRLGFHMTERGYHTLGSINHLAVLEHDYIELIGFEPNAANVRTDILRYPCGLNALVFRMSEANSVYAELQNSDVFAEPPAWAQLASAIRHRDPLHLNEKFRPREPSGGNECARREIVAENLLPNLQKTRAVTRVSDEHCHGHHVGKFGSNFLERASKLCKHRPDLTVKIPC